MNEIQRMITKYNEIQMVYNEDAFGPLQNDSVIVVIQVFYLIIYNLDCKSTAKKSRCMKVESCRE